MQPKKRPVTDETTQSASSKRTTRSTSFASPAPTSANSNINDDEHVPIKTEAPDDFPLGTPTITKNTLMWFRNDLRVQDNRALYAASMRSKVGLDSGVLALYVLSPEEWTAHDEAAVKIDFWMRNLVSLKADLAALDIPLVVRTAERQEDVVGVVRETVRECGVSHVFWNRELMVDEQKRDRKVKQALEEERVTVEVFDDQCIVPPREVRTKTGNPYAVFTPFYKTWCHLVETDPHYLDLAHAPESNRSEARTLFQKHFAASIPSSYPHDLDTDEIQRLFPAGEQAAHTRLSEFVQKRAAHYHVRRDVPHEQQGCSMLSAYLNAGVLSTRQCVVAARAANKNRILSGDEGLKTWIKELGWREFYRNILVSFPRVCKSRAFQPITEKIQWSDNQVHFRAWCQGKTGFPIVDAGMRQLNKIGYMHNRLRMIVACFLVKDLMISWQWGEKYFMQRLIDGDLASNNGGWQWSASTGTDAQPYFRVFNPLLQSQRFDPNGTFIRRWVPELKGLTDKQIHEPHKILAPAQFAKLNYPKPIVDHATAKTRYVEEFKRILATK
ncbi:hypothetical protein BG003_000658 [Podila horticola]|nr:hypothetical protein BG003_000658 [Podila horticola]